MSQTHPKPFSTSASLQLRMVSFLINNDGSWNEKRIRDNFLPWDVKAILKIPRIHNDFREKSVWNYEDNGSFSVKSAYNLAVSLDAISRPSSSNIEGKNELWIKLWRLQMPSKIKIFLWRLLHNILPSKDNLQAR